MIEDHSGYVTLQTTRKIYQNLLHPGDTNFVSWQVGFQAIKMLHFKIKGTKMLAINRHYNRENSIIKLKLVLMDNLFSTKISQKLDITMYDSVLLQQFIHLITGKFIIKTTAKKSK